MGHFLFDAARIQQKRIEELEAALRGIVNHWYEFGEMMARDQYDYGHG